jgi:hypothetical protein
LCDGTVTKARPSVTPSIGGNRAAKDIFLPPANGEICDAVTNLR